MEKVSGEKSVIMRDFNYHIDWENMEAERPQDEAFMECLSDNFLTQHVSEATRGCNILDLVITSDEQLVENVNVGENFGTSDHQIVTFDLKIMEGRSNVQNQNKKNFFKGNYDQARKMIDEMNMVDMIRGKDAEQSWRIFSECTSKVMELTIPRQKKLNKKLPWVTREVQKRRRAKIKAWNKLKAHQTMMKKQ